MPYRCLYACENLTPILSPEHARAGRASRRGTMEMAPPKGASIPGLGLSAEDLAAAAACAALTSTGGPPKRAASSAATAAPAGRKSPTGHVKWDENKLPGHARGEKGDGGDGSAPRPAPRGRRPRRRSRHRASSVSTSAKTLRAEMEKAKKYSLAARRRKARV